MLLRPPTPLLSSTNLQCLLLLERRFKFKNAARNRSNPRWEHAVEINSATRWIRVSGEALAYIARGLCTQSLSYVCMLMTFVHETCSTTLTQKSKQKIELKHKNLNSNNLTCPEHKQNYILTQANMHKHKRSQKTRLKHKKKNRK